MSLKVLFLLIPLLLSACSSSLGNEARSDTFDEGAVNRLELVRIVEIKHVSKAHMVIDSKNAPAPVRDRSNGLLVDLAMLPLNIGSAVVSGHSLTGTGSDDGKIVDAVGIDYIDRIDPYTPVMRSTQRGSVCEYKVGAAELVRTEQGETRIQPNDKC
ncbi:MAG: putative outer membrane lipoprotein [Caudoviricetes sp.]|nr:MAG: putative outer membrane lipoprotein [Caudoviricetes sp.]